MQPTADIAPESKPTSQQSPKPWIGFVLLVAMLAMAGGGKVILYDTFDPDAFWHLRVADQLAGQGAWPTPLVDHLSYRSSAEPWTPYSWLAERGMRTIWEIGGYRAAIGVQALIEAGFIVLLALASVEMTRLATGKPMYLASALASLMGGILSLAYLSFRPNTFAIFLLALIGWILLRDRRLQQKSKAVWLVLPLTALLANVHFFSVLVPLWAGALLVGDWIEKRQGNQNRRVARGIWLTVACAICSLATPLVVGNLRSILLYQHDDAMVRAGNIEELTPFYGGTMGHVSGVLVVLLLICLVWRCAKGNRPGLGELIWFVGGAVLLMKMGRMAPMFAIIAAPLFAATMPRLSDRTLAKPLVIGVLALVLVTRLISLAQAFPPESKSFSTWLTRLGPDINSYPCGAADYVDHNVPPASGRLINEMTWGGYLDWRLGDRYRTLMDGRTQIFPPAFWQATYLGSAEDRKRVVQTADADVAILPKKNSLFKQTLTDLHWKTVYQDDQATVMMPPGHALASVH